MQSMQMKVSVRQQVWIELQATAGQQMRECLQQGPPPRSCWRHRQWYRQTARGIDNGIDKLPEA